MTRTRYALSRKSNDRFPIFFRSDCERTLFNPQTGKDETLVEVIERLNRSGYDLINSRDELISILRNRGVKV